MRKTTKPDTQRMSTESSIVKIPLNRDVRT